MICICSSQTRTPYNMRTLTRTYPRISRSSKIQFSMPPATQGDLIIVTGSGNLIASHVVNELFLAGTNVRGIVRRLEKNEWTQRLFDKSFGMGRYERVVVADFANVGAYHDAVKGMTRLRSIDSACHPTVCIQGRYLQQLRTLFRYSDCSIRLTAQRHTRHHSHRQVTRLFDADFHQVSTAVHTGVKTVLTVAIKESGISCFNLSSYASGAA
jgi:hypothetical protein